MMRSPQALTEKEDNRPMPPILTITMNPALDKSARVDRVAAEQKLACSAPRFDPGGGGINVARVVHELGGDVTALYLVGGHIGAKLRELLDDTGVDHIPLKISGATRSNFTVLDEASKQQFRFGMPGPMVDANEWQQVLAWLDAQDWGGEQEAEPRYVVASGSLPPGVPVDFYAEVAERVREHGARFVVDTRGEPLRRAVAQGVYLIKPNARELGTLAERDMTGEEDQEAAAQAIIAQGQSSVVVVSLGASGALLVTEDQCTRIRAPAVQPVSKIGAGDSTLGAIVLALSRGDSMVDAVRYGVAAGAAAVLSPGTSLCRLDAVNRLYRKISDGE